MCNSNRSPVPVRDILKIEHPVASLATIAYVYAAYAVPVTIFSAGGKF